MTETAYILRNATARSLVIMDEVGRGTATADGLSLAWAISEYLLQAVGAKTLFATHYHELAQLVHPRLKNLCLDVLEAEGKIVFLKKVIDGVAAHSYGIHVAQRAGLPESVLERAVEIMQSGNATALSSAAGLSQPLPPPIKKKNVPENGLFSEEELVINELLSINSDNMTPLQALQAITRWKETLMAEK